MSAKTQIQGPELPGLTFVQWLGSGGFSDVFLYERERPRIKVAVKVLKADALDSTQLRQFVSEAEVMAELAEHPFIVPVLGSGTTPEGRPYLEMRYYPQADLAERVSERPMGVPEALKVGIQLASAIETAHRANIIHRDIKPGNILMSSYGVPGLTDFGIAGRPGEVAEDDDNVGVSMPWSPPEVLSGKSNGSRTSDVYSLAATVWHLLVGRSPFAMPGGDNTERGMFARILHSKPPSVGRADVPNSLDRLLQMSLSKDPSLRPRTAMEFARGLQRVEQEMRLARTEIVVLDTKLHEPAPAPEIVPTPSPSVAPARPVDPLPRDEATTRRPASVSPSAERTTQRPPSVVPAAGTTARPAKPEPAPAPTHRRMDSGATTRAPKRASADLTQVKPAVAGDSADVATVETEQDGRRSRVPAILATVVLALAVIGGAVYIASNGSSDKKNTTLPNTPGPTSITQIVGSGVTPSVVASRKSGSSAVFSWTRASGQTYVVTVDATGKHYQPSGTSISVPFGSAPQVCIKVAAYRGTDVAITPKCQPR